MAHDTRNIQELFPTDLPGGEWVEFDAQGFSQPVIGAIYRGGLNQDSGMPLGGMGTGNIDLNLTGCFGEWTIYNNLVNHRFTDTAEAPRPHYAPRKAIPRNIDLPFLGLAVEKQSWVLTLRELEGVGKARQIHYWGHYPVADLEYELDAPVEVGLRAWSPFLPGDATASNTPGAVFEVQLRNTSGSAKRGTLAFSIPGPAEYETLGKAEWRQQVTQGDFSGVVMTTAQPDGTYEEGPLHGSRMPFGYALGVVGCHADIRWGGFLGADGEAWSDISRCLPRAQQHEPGTSVAVDFELKPNQAQTIRFIVAWYAPLWPDTPYTNVYGLRFKNPLDVAQFLAKEHYSLLKRVLAWQQVIYEEKELPRCLRDALVNRLYIMTQGSSYIKGPGAAMTEDGLFSIFEAAGYVPYHETMICTYWSHYPTLFFFPEVRLTTLRGVAALQHNDGRLPFRLGKEDYTVNNPNYDEQYVVNALYYVQMVKALCQRVNDEQLVHEFYPSVKRAIQFEATLDHYRNGLVSLDPEFPHGQPWDGWKWYGNSTYIAGHWLCSLRIAEEMAVGAGDPEFAQQCRQWIERAGRSLEETLWNEESQSYMMFDTPGAEKRSETILVAQFESELNCHLVGLPGVFPSDRLTTALATMKRLCVEPAVKGVFPAGVPCGVRPDGSVDEDWGGMGTWVFPQCNEHLAALYAYRGDRKTAEDLLQVTLDALALTHQIAWDFPGAFKTPGASEPYVADYSNGMSIWWVPMAFLGQGIQEFCASGGLVDRILKAAGSAGGKVGGRAAG
jgi:uncharacterized protein (DUF608 family)